MWSIIINIDIGGKTENLVQISININTRHEPEKMLKQKYFNRNINIHKLCKLVIKLKYDYLFMCTCFQI